MEQAGGLGTKGRYIVSPGQIIPSRGDEIVVRRTGISRRGRVYYADQVQMLVKWDDGGSSSLRIGHTPFEVISRAST